MEFKGKNETEEDEEKIYDAFREQCVSILMSFVARSRSETRSMSHVFADSLID